MSLNDTLILQWRHPTWRCEFFLLNQNGRPHEFLVKKDVITQAVRLRCAYLSVTLYFVIIIVDLKGL